MATEARPAFVAITGRFELEALAAAARFAASVREAFGDEGESRPDVIACSTLATRAFGGDPEAWPALVAAVRSLLSASAGTAGEGRSWRELRAFVAENADLLEA
jgi:hypothetical protein